MLARHMFPRRFVALLAVLLVATLLVPAAHPASAAPGDAVATITSITATPSEATGGQTITYQVNYTCSNAQSGDGCDGTVLKFPVPTFPDVYGNDTELAWSGGTAPGGWGTFSSVMDPELGRIVRTTATSLPAGSSGLVVLNFTVPRGKVEWGAALDLSAHAELHDPEAPAPFVSDTVHVALTGTAVSTLGITSVGGSYLNLNTVWLVHICWNASIAPVYEITQTLPAGFEFISAENGGVFTDDGDTPGISDGEATVTWVFDEDNPIEWDVVYGCFRSNVVGKFPAGYVHPNPTDPANDNNVVGAQKRSHVSGTATSRDGVEQKTLTPDVSTKTLFQAQVVNQFRYQFANAAGSQTYYAAPGMDGQLQLELNLSGGMPIRHVVVETNRWSLNSGEEQPGVPGAFRVDAIRPGSWTGDALLSVYGSDDDFDTVTLIADNITAGASDIELTERYQSYRFEWSFPEDVETFNAGSFLLGQIDVDDYTPNDRYWFRANGEFTVMVNEGEDGPVEHVTDGFATGVFYMLNPTPSPRVYLSMTPTLVAPGGSTKLLVIVDNQATATGQLIDPVVTLCIPDSLEDGGPLEADQWTEIEAEATCNEGRYARQFIYDGALNPSQDAEWFRVPLQVSTNPPAAAGNHPITALVNTSITDCPIGYRCTTRSLTVSPSFSFQAHACVHGHTRSGCGPFGGPNDGVTTTPGGPIEYELHLRNTGNVDGHNIEFIDILPHVGDISVLGEGTTGRGSMFSPVLTEPIEAPPGWTVLYSTSANPCRPEVGGPAANCDDPDWTDTPDPLALSTYRSIKLSHPGVIPGGETATFTWTMRAPVHDQTYTTGSGDPYDLIRGCVETCPTAANSFAYGVDATNLPTGMEQPGRFTAEPPQVKVGVMAPLFDNMVGDRVWFDKNFNGIQDPDETGVPDILVQLWSGDGDTLLGTTFTDSDGYYRFDSYLDDGEYRELPDETFLLRFFLHEGWGISPQGAGSDPTLDSDIPSTWSGTDPSLGGYYETEAGLGDHWDAGLWRPAPDLIFSAVTMDADWDMDMADDDVSVDPDRPIVWLYAILNTGNTRLENIQVSDDGGGDNPFTVTDCLVLNPGVNDHGLETSAEVPLALNRGGLLVCMAFGTSELGTYVNTATVSAEPRFDDGSLITVTPPAYPVLPEITATDTSGYVATMLPTADEVETWQGEQVELNVLANDSSLYWNPVDGLVDGWRYRVVTHPRYGSFTCDNWRAVPFLNTGFGNCLYRPIDGFVGVDSAEYELCDATYTSCLDPVPVTFTVHAINKVPFVYDDAAVTTLGEPITFNVLDNDVDPDSDPITLVSFTQPSVGSVTCTNDGDCVWTPPEGFVGITSFTYVAADNGRSGPEKPENPLEGDATVTLRSDPEPIDLSRLSNRTSEISVVTTAGLPSSWVLDLSPGCATPWNSGDNIETGIQMWVDMVVLWDNYLNLEGLEGLVFVIERRLAGDEDWVEVQRIEPDYNLYEYRDFRVGDYEYTWRARPEMNHLTSWNGELSWMEEASATVTGCAHSETD